MGRVGRRARSRGLVGGALLVAAAGCGDGSDGLDGSGSVDPVRAARDAISDDSISGQAIGAADGDARSAEPASPRREDAVVRDGRARARVDVSSGAPVIVLAGERHPLAGPDGGFDRQSAEALFAALEAAGAFLEIELVMPPEVPGKVVEEMVFFLEEKGKVPIVSSPAEPEDSP